MSAPDFVAVGHVTLDRFGGTQRPGGAALYAAITARRLGLSAGILTSHADDFPLDLIPSSIEVVTVPATATTTFAHDGEGRARVLTLAARAGDLRSEHVPADWADASLVLLAPVIQELDPLLADGFPEATLGAAIQGWLRETGVNGLVGPREWESPEWLLGRVAALFASVDDVRGRENDVLAWVQHVPVAVLTAGAAGALLYVSGDRYEVPAVAAHAVDTTGAGDVFAATFLVWQHEGADAWEAARAASCAAALSTAGVAWSSVPDRGTLESAIAEYRRAADASP